MFDDDQKDDAYIPNHSVVIVDIDAGSNDIDSQEWAAVLVRMYALFGNRQGWDVETLKHIGGLSRGCTQSATLRISGKYASGYLQGESGVHRIVRVSPHDPQRKRHTSFASVDITEEVPDSIRFSTDIPDLGWGDQVRSYVLDPYQSVKDLRTEYETRDTHDVFNGDLLPFVNAYLTKRGAGVLMP